MNRGNEPKKQTFWEHLDILRGDLLRVIGLVAACSLAAFCLKSQLFKIVLAPCSSSFISYRLLKAEPFTIRLINVGLTEQFAVHVKTALAAGIYAASPYVIYLLYQFVAPALYQRERHYASRIVCSGYLMFILGSIINYFLVFPLTVRFLGTYQVSDAVSNLLSLQSYIDTLLTMSVVFGIIFEIPVLSWILSLSGLLRPEWMIRYRRHAIVAIVIIAAVITPTGDAFTLLMVSLPIWLLYEVSVYIVKVSYKRKT